MKRCIAATPLPMVKELKALGDNLNEMRQRQGQSRAMMAERCMCTERDVARVEAGDPGTPIGLYASMLFMLCLTGQLKQVGRHWRTEAQARELVEKIRGLVLREPNSVHIEDEVDGSA